MELVVEKSKSRTGKHAIRRMILIVRDSDVVEVEGPCVKPAQKTYSKGEACYVRVEPSRDEYVVYVVLVRGLRGRVKGYIEVYDADGNLLYRAVYRRLKLRYSKGNPHYAWIVELVARRLGLPVKRYNLVPAWIRKGR